MSFQHGARSQYLPVRLQERALAAMNDPDLLGLRQELGALDARITELYGRIDAGAGDHWLRAREIMRALIAARDARRVDDFHRRINELDEVLSGGSGDYAIWSELRGLFQERRKLVESERRRLVENQLMMPADEVLTYGTALMLAVKQHVRDPETLHRIMDTFSRMNTIPERT